MTNNSIHLVRCVLLFLASAVSAADGPEDCAAINDATARLACYDLSATRKATAEFAPEQPPVPEVPAAPAASELDKFGAEALPPTQAEKAAQNKELKAHIKGAFNEWKHGKIFELDNGQTWKAVTYDEVRDSKIPPDPAVTITKSVFGGYWMKLDGTDRSLRVRRVK